MWGKCQMLGYVKISKGRLTGNGYELYRGVYCSLCNALGRNYGPAARLLLSYDFAFAAVLRIAVTDPPCAFKKCRCPVKPTRHFFCCKSDETADLCAHSIVITAYYKLLDNLHDREFLKKIGSALLFPLVALMHRKAKKKAPEIEEIVSTAMKNQLTAEAKDDAFLDECAEPSADALGRILALGAAEEYRENLYKIGYFTGRFVYILDAADDLEKDLKTGSFNPFAKEFSAPLSPEDKKRFAGRARASLNATHSALLEVKDDTHFRRFKDIIENIAFDGLCDAADSVIARYTGEKKDKDTITV